MARVLHIMGVMPDKFGSAFQDFVNTSLSHHEHSFVAFFTGALDDRKQPASKRSFDLLPSGTLHRIMFLRNRIRNWPADVVIFHNMYGNRRELTALLGLFAVSDLSFRAVWSIWGADVYKFQNRELGIKSVITEVFRRVLLRRVHYVTAGIPGDTDLARIHYAPFAQAFEAFYTSPEMLDAPCHRTEDGGVPIIQVGNSPDPANEHEVIFQLLVKLRGEFQVFCPLAYGPRVDIVRIASRGRALFGEKFISLEQTIPAKDYFQLLTKVRVAIFNHNRQGGLGNIIGLLQRGAKVYLRADTTTSYFLRKIGVPVFDTNSLKNIETLEQLVQYQVDLPAIQANLGKRFSIERSAELWDDLIYKVASQSPKPRYVMRAYHCWL